MVETSLCQDMVQLEGLEENRRKVTYIKLLAKNVGMRWHKREMQGRKSVRAVDMCKI